jgi:hypothetical protein
MQNRFFRPLPNSSNTEIKGGALFVAEKNTDVYNYCLNLTVQKMEWEKRAELFKLIRGAVTIIIKDKNGKCLLFGKDAPAMPEILEMPEKRPSINREQLTRDTNKFKDTLTPDTKQYKVDKPLMESKFNKGFKPSTYGFRNLEKNIENTGSFDDSNSLTNMQKGFMFRSGLYGRRLGGYNG